MKAVNLIFTGIAFIGFAIFFVCSAQLSSAPLWEPSPYDRDAYTTWCGWGIVVTCVAIALGGIIGAIVRRNDPPEVEEPTKWTTDPIEFNSFEEADAYRRLHGYYPSYAHQVGNKVSAVFRYKPL